ncbi:MAG: threonine synthase [Alphaproteobacteria bacterium]|nr:threonine synthase [Alphaproteobacteria bacterium]
MRESCNLRVFYSDYHHSCKERKSWQPLLFAPVLRQYACMTMLYHSTRGQPPNPDLRGVTLAGLAPDGGLYVPMAWPEFSAEAIARMKDKSYIEIAQQVLKPFMQGILPDDALSQLLQQAYAHFDDPAITPLKQLDERHWVLELFHGPTLAFKDIALQFLGPVFEYFLAQSGERMTVIGATSGDTGSAAMAALAGRKNIDVFILYPAKGPSDIQRKQMTCLDAPNIHAIAIDGSFDACQSLVKSLFSNTAFRARQNLAAVNSINWMRILAQMVYYFVAAAKTAAPRPVSFAVPTGNFGNIYAAYAAMQCGLSVSKLAVASNRNDILTRFFASGHMKTEPAHATLSPSMDIQISSNFERLLFDLCGRDAAKLGSLMNSLSQKGEFNVTPLQLGQARQIFTAARADDALTLTTIKDVYAESGYILDPHSAVGVAAARILARELPEPVIMLATAHPAKFPDVIQSALGLKPPLPEKVAVLLQKPERFSSLPADAQAVETFITERTVL